MQTIIHDGVLQSFYCIQILHDRRWLLLSGEDGILRYKTAKVRDAKMRELSSLKS
jgi:hypothetical protein